MSHIRKRAPAQRRSKMSTTLQAQSLGRPPASREQEGAARNARRSSNKYEEMQRNPILAQSSIEAMLSCGIRRTVLAQGMREPTKMSSEKQNATHDTDCQTARLQHSLSEPWTKIRNGRLEPTLVCARDRLLQGQRCLPPRGRRGKIPFVRTRLRRSDERDMDSWKNACSVQSAIFAKGSSFSA